MKQDKLKREKAKQGWKARQVSQDGGNEGAGNEREKSKTGGGQVIGKLIIIKKSGRPETSTVMEERVPPIVIIRFELSLLFFYACISKQIEPFGS